VEFYPDSGEEISKGKSAEKESRIRKTVYVQNDILEFKGLFGKEFKPTRHP
jgi:hypothetical protein